MDFATLDSLKTVIVSLIQSKPYGDGVEIEKKVVRRSHTKENGLCTP